MALVERIAREASDTDLTLYQGTGSRLGAGQRRAMLMDSVQHYTRGEIAHHAGVGIETLRFYERKGLIAPPPRAPSGYRQYNDETLLRLQLIRRMKRLGFPLREVSALFTVHLRTGDDCAAVEGQARKRLADVRAKIHDLKLIETALRQLVKACAANPAKADCPLMSTLSSGK